MEEVSKIPQEWNKFYLKNVSFVNLMTRRIFNVLIVANPYDAFMLEDDGRVDEKIFDEYMELGMRYPPTFRQVSTTEEAHEVLHNTDIDLVICMPGNADNDAFTVAREIKAEHPNIPCVVLTPFSHGITKRIQDEGVEFYSNNAINVIYGSAAPKVSEIQSMLIGRFSTTFSALAETLDNQEEPEKLTIEPTVKNQSLPLAVSYVGKTPEGAQKQLAKYIQQVDDWVNEELEQDLKDNIALQMKNLQDSLKTQEVVAQEQKDLRIRQIQEALQYGVEFYSNVIDINVNNKNASSQVFGPFL